MNSSSNNNRASQSTRKIEEREREGRGERVKREGRERDMTELAPKCERSAIYGKYSCQAVLLL